MLETMLEMLHDYIEFDDASITRDTEFQKDLSMSSFDIMAFIGDVEDRFEISLEVEEVQDILTVGEFVDLVESKTK